MNSELFDFYRGIIRNLKLFHYIWRIDTGSFDRAWNEFYQRSGWKISVFGTEWFLLEYLFEVIFNCIGVEGDFNFIYFRNIFDTIHIAKSRIHDRISLTINPISQKFLKSIKYPNIKSIEQRNGDSSSNKHQNQNTRVTKDNTVYSTLREETFSFLF